MTPLKIKVEKTNQALILEASGIDFNLFQHQPYDAGYDVKACIQESYLLQPNTTVLIPTGLHIELSDPYYEIQVRPRSGLAAKHGITILNSPGTVDFLYREEIKVILYNAGTVGPFIIEPGHRIAQLCFRQLTPVEIEYADIETTDRSGFGSSGI